MPADDLHKSLTIFIEINLEIKRHDSVSKRMDAVGQVITAAIHINAKMCTYKFDALPPTDNDTRMGRLCGLL